MQQKTQSPVEKTARRVSRPVAPTQPRDRETKRSGRNDEACADWSDLVMESEKRVIVSIEESRALLHTKGNMTQVGYKEMSIPHLTYNMT